MHPSGNVALGMNSGPEESGREIATIWGFPKPLEPCLADNAGMQCHEPAMIRLRTPRPIAQKGSTISFIHTSSCWSNAERSNTLTKPARFAEHVPLS